MRILWVPALVALYLLGGLGAGGYAPDDHAALRYFASSPQRQVFSLAERPLDLVFKRPHQAPPHHSNPLPEGRKNVEEKDGAEKEKTQESRNSAFSQTCSFSCIWAMRRQAWQPVVSGQTVTTVPRYILHHSWRWGMMVGV